MVSIVAVVASLMLVFATGFVVEHQYVLDKRDRMQATADAMIPYLQNRNLTLTQLEDKALWYSTINKVPLEYDSEGNPRVLVVEDIGHSRTLELGIDSGTLFGMLFGHTGIPIQVTMEVAIPEEDCSNPGTVLAPTHTCGFMHLPRAPATVVNPDPPSPPPPFVGEYGTNNSSLLMMYEFLMELVGGLDRLDEPGPVFQETTPPIPPKFAPVDTFTGLCRPYHITHKGACVYETVFCEHLRTGTTRPRCEHPSVNPTSDRVYNFGDSGKYKELGKREDDGTLPEEFRWGYVIQSPTCDADGYRGVEYEELCRNDPRHLVWDAKEAVYVARWEACTSDYIQFNTCQSPPTTELCALDPLYFHGARPGNYEDYVAQTLRLPVGGRSTTPVACDFR